MNAQTHREATPREEEETSVFGVASSDDAVVPMEEELGYELRDEYLDKVMDPIEDFVASGCTWGSFFKAVTSFMSALLDEMRYQRSK